jgi:hypothetical protein
MVKANVKYDIKVHSAAVRSSPAYRIYRALAYAGAIEFILVSFIIVITAVSRHKVTLSLILLLSVFLGIFAGCAIKLLLMNPVRSFRSFSSYCPGLRYELTVDGDRIELFSESENLKKKATYSISRLNSARETMGYFKLNITEAGSLFFSDTDITEGTAEELRNLLTAALGKKYTTKEGWL